jgi:hypothetical protein
VREWVKEMNMAEELEYESEMDELLDDALAYAEQLLESGEEFIPFGQELMLDGGIEGVFVDVEQEIDANQYREILHNHLAERLSAGEILGYGVCCDTRIGDDGVETDAILVELEHVDIASTIVLVPYERNDLGELEFGEPFIEQRGEPDVHPNGATGIEN